MSFDALGLSPALLRAVAEEGYGSPTPIQQQFIPPVQSGRDVIAYAQSGMGKTAAVVLSLLERLFPGGTRQHHERPRALILTATNEQATQWQSAFENYARHLELDVPVSIALAADAKVDTVDILVATPEAADSLFTQWQQIDQVHVVLLDGVDEWPNDGQVLQRLIDVLPKSRQTLVIAASPSEEVDRLATDLMSEPAIVQVQSPRRNIPAVEHQTWVVAPGRKRDALQHLISQNPERQSLVFCRTKHGADKIARFLERWGHLAAAYHGAKSQGARARALAGFTSGELKILVATDIAARHFDLTALPVVVNYDFPYVADDFISRIARTGQSGGAGGLSLNLVTQDDTPQYRAVQSLLDGILAPAPLEGFEPAEAFDPSKDPPPRETREPQEPRPPRHRAPAPATAESADGEPRRNRRRRGRKERAPTAQPLSLEGLPVDEDDQAQAIGAVRPDGEATNAERPRRERRRRRKRSPGDANAPVDLSNVLDDVDADAQADIDDDRPQRGNSIHAPPIPQYPQVRGRRRGRSDPFAPVVVDENRANVFDERQPDDFRDQWSVLGPDASRPAWTYADHRQPSPEVRRAPGAPRNAAPRGTPRGAPRSVHSDAAPRDGAPRGRRRQRPRSAADR